MDRWVAEFMERTPNIGNNAASVGTAVHGALEEFVRAVYIEKTHAGLDRVQQKELLITFYQISYVKTFGTSDMETPEYDDGFKLSMRWFERTTWDDVEYVESVELKETIAIPYNHPDGTVHEIPFNYIMDRVDYLGNNVWRVVDYKSIRALIQPGELETKLQARAYALAIQIKHPEAERINVIFDLLRHEPVGLVITREDNVAFWRFLCAETQRIVNTKPEDIKPNLNSECKWCVKNVTCEAFQLNAINGGIMGLSIDEIAGKYEQMLDMQTTLNIIVPKLEEELMKHAAKTEVLDWETTDGREVSVFTTNGRRSVNAERVQELLGEKLFAKYGKTSMTVTALDELIKDPTLDPLTRKKLKDTITKGNGQLKVKVSKKKMGF
jgi:hypothetical protein